MTNLFEHITAPIPFPEIINQIKEAIPAFRTLRKRAEKAIFDMRQRSNITLNGKLTEFDLVTRDLTTITRIVEHLESVCSDDQIRAVNEELQKEYTEFSAALYSDPELYKFFKDAGTGVSDNRALNTLLRSFETSGATLSEADRAIFIEIEKELSELTTRFSQAVLDSTKEWSWYVEDRAQLPGVLDSDCEVAREAAIASGKSHGYLFSLHAPSFRAIVSFHEDSSIREKFVRAYHRRASEGEHDNTARIGRILNLRKQRSKLLGYADFAEVMTADRMAKKPSTVRAFFESIKDAVLVSAKRDLQTLLVFAQHNGFPKEKTLAAWDIPFYLQRYEKQELGLDPETLREYFPFESTLEAIFQLLTSVFGVSFAEEKLPLWSPGVQSFRAHGLGKDLGSLYTDYYARENKRAGAWMDMLLPAVAGVSKGIGFMGGNFSKPTADKPAMLTHDEVTTLFHEAGHLLHGLVCETPLLLEGMGAVAWDFIEVPSQLLENWAWEPSVLKRITKHFKTGQPMPDDLIARLVKSRSLMNGLFYARHLANSALDLEMHTTFDQARDGDPVAWSRKFLKGFVPHTPDDSATINSFTHLFSDPDGYAAGYYSYLWSESLEADIFTKFAGANVLDRKLGEKLVRDILMPGNMQDAAVLFENFMGRAPSNAALLRRVAGEG